jgi:osmotically-inducible protein OsmY
MTAKYAGLLLTLALLANSAGCGVLLVGGAAAGAGIVHDRRTAGTIVEDQSIETKTYQAFANYPELSADESAHINVTSYNTAVLLSGEVATPEAKQRAEDIARNIEKVSLVHNELVVGSPKSLGSRINDTTITGKVHAALFQIDPIPDFDPSRVKVVTEAGTVYLFGLVKPNEAEAVTEAARHVGGVQQVVLLFEYLPANAPAPAAADAPASAPRSDDGFQES